MLARTSFQSICRGVGQNVRPLASSWVSSCERVTLLRSFWYFSQRTVFQKCSWPIDKQ